MGPISILLSGMAVVLGGILVLRMHAFLALLLGALTVAALTPAELIFESELISQGFRIAEPFEAEIAREGEPPASGAEPGIAVLTGRDRQLSAGEYGLFRQEAGKWQALGQLKLSVSAKQKGAETQLVEVASSSAKETPQAGDLLATQASIKAAAKGMEEPLGDRIATGFGKTCLQIGILIALASIVGECLLNSGAAQRVVASSRRMFGEERTPWAFLVSGFVVAIPVFFDTVFLLLIPLGKAMRLQTGKNYLLYILSIAAGGTMAHSLVPPTPGPLLVASELGVSMGAMIIGGTIVGGLASLAGYAYAVWANKRWDIPLRETAAQSSEHLEALSKRDEASLPPLWLSLAPILLPVFFIAGQATLESYYDGVPAAELPGWVALVKPAVDILGQKNIAMIVATALGLFTMAWHTRSSRKEMTETVQTALTGGAVIILITGAGGAFGQVLKQTNIAGTIQNLVPPSQAGLTLLLVAFFVTALVRIAQGSATVAMITAVGIVGPIAAAITLPFHPVYLALAVGCGSKPIPWMNDSGFWLISRMCGLTEAEMLRSVSVMLTLMGIVGMAFTMIGAWLFPLV